MGIGKRIKQARETANLTQKELAEIIGVTPSAITNYENETSHPKEPILYSLINALHVDANFLFQDCVEISKDFISLEEKQHIKKYRALDEHGKKMVDFVLDEEHSRCAAADTDIQYIQVAARGGGVQTIPVNMKELEKLPLPESDYEP